MNIEIRHQVLLHLHRAKASFIHALMFLVLCASTGCGDHPRDLASGRDIQRAPADSQQIRVGFLPLNDYPLLSRFHNLDDIDFFTMDGTGADDKRLEVLSRVKLEKLRSVCLLNCPAVTDAGIRHLAKFASLQELGLEGTSISDQALEIMASEMKVTGVNVANCPKVTKLGLLKLAGCESLKEFSFSSTSLSGADVEELISKLKNVKWLGVVDPPGKLDAAHLEALAKEKGITLWISPIGALQNVTTNVSRP